MVDPTASHTSVPETYRGVDTSDEELTKGNYTVPK